MRLGGQLAPMSSLAIYGSIVFVRYDSMVAKNENQERHTIFVCVCVCVLVSNVSRLVLVAIILVYIILVKR